MRNKRLSIVPGWAEGRWHTKKLADALEKAGWKISDNIAEAAIIITHSAGGVYIPAGVKPEIIISINPAYWPGRPVILSIYQNIIRDLPKQARAWGLSNLTAKLAWNVFYIAAAPVRSVLTPKALSKTEFLPDKNQTRFVIIRNKDDAFCSAAIKELKAENVKYFELPGLHEDVWFNPEPYVKLMTEELK